MSDQITDQTIKEDCQKRRPEKSGTQEKHDPKHGTDKNTASCEAFDSMKLASAKNKDIRNSIDPGKFQGFKDLDKPLYDAANKLNGDLRGFFEGRPDTTGTKPLFADKFDSAEKLRAEKDAFSQKLHSQPSPEIANDISKRQPETAQLPRPSDQPREQQRRPEPEPPHPAASAVSALENDHFAGVAKSVIAKIDKSGRGEVTKDQLAKALQDPQFKGQEAQALAALYQNYDRLAGLGRPYDEFLQPGISNTDIDQYDRIQKVQNKRVKDAFEAAAWSDMHIQNLSKDGKSLSEADIDAGLKNNSLSVYERRTLQYAKDHFQEIGHGKNITRKDFDNYASSTIADTGNAKLTLGGWGAIRSVNDSQKPGISRDLYGPGGAEASIKPEAVKQGATGDCYFEADLAAVARAHPELIRDAITRNPDGTYTVRFPGAKDEPITVQPPTEAELGTYDPATPQGTWAAVMEKAYGQYLDAHFWRRLPHVFSGDTPQETAGHGGFTGSSMDLLTGGSHHSVNLIFHSQAGIAEELQKAFSKEPPKAVSAGILGFFGGKNDDGFDTKHDYTILGFVPDGKGGGTVRVRNPHAGKDGTPDGTIEIPLSTFMRNFSDMAIED